MEKTYLTIEEVNSILPPSDKIDMDIKHFNRIVYTTVKGKYLPITCSKISRGDHINYNICTDYYLEIGCEKVCFVIDRLGVILIPIDVLKRYNKFSGWKAKTKKGKQYWIRGLVKDGVITLVNARDVAENIQANDYFFPFEV